MASAFGLDRLTRTIAWAEAVGLAVLAIGGRAAINRWTLARMGAAADVDPLAAAILPELCFCVLIVVQAALLARRRGLGLRSLGLRASDATGQIVWGIGMAAAAYVCGWGVRWLLCQVPGGAPETQVPDFFFESPPVGLIGVYALGAVQNHVLYTALLLPRLCRATGSVVIAVALEAIVVAVPYVIAGYDYRVTASVVPVIVVISLLYLRARSLPAAVLGGFLHEFVGFILMPRLI